MAHLTVNSIAATYQDLYTVTATVDPNNTIPERNENNNTASSLVSVSCCN